MDLLTDDLMLKIMDIRCEDIENNVEKLEKAVFEHSNLIDEIENELELFPDNRENFGFKFYNVEMITTKIKSMKEIFKPIVYGKVVFFNEDFDSDVIINPNILHFCKNIFDDYEWNDFDDELEDILIDLDNLDMKLAKADDYCDYEDYLYGADIQFIKMNRPFEM